MIPKPRRVKRVGFIVVGSDGGFITLGRVR
jgi:hypothetical protein